VTETDIPAHPSKEEPGEEEEDLCSDFDVDADGATVLVVPVLARLEDIDRSADAGAAVDDAAILLPLTRLRFDDFPLPLLVAGVFPPF
jgi:hypothetical protein